MILWLWSSPARVTQFRTMRWNGKVWMVSLCSVCVRYDTDRGTTTYHDLIICFFLVFQPHRSHQRPASWLTSLATGREDGRLSRSGVLLGGLRAEFLDFPLQTTGFFSSTCRLLGHEVSIVRCRQCELSYLANEGRRYERRGTSCCLVGEP